jgi:hypothetical protein
MIGRLKALKLAAPGMRAFGPPRLRISPGPLVALPARQTGKRPESRKSAL